MKSGVTALKLIGVYVPTCHWQYTARNSVLLFVFCDQKDNANAIHTDMRPSVLRDQQYMLGITNLLIIEKVLFIKINLADHQPSLCFHLPVTSLLIDGINA